MARVSQPELKRYLDKRVVVNIQGGRRVQGVLRGFDMYLNLVVDESIEMVKPEGGAGNAWREAANCGTIVSQCALCVLSDADTTMQVVRGNSVTSLEGLETIKTKIQ